jgi:ring-1,2-phenylacetyl-CoA epoxidase subunit PaaC
LFPYALGIFEPGADEQTLINDKVFIGEEALKEQWLEGISNIIEKAGLKMPNIEADPSYGGRKNKHTEHLSEMLQEMTEVYQIDPNAEW